MQVSVELISESGANKVSMALWALNAALPKALNTADVGNDKGKGTLRFLFERVSRGDRAARREFFAAWKLVYAQLEKDFKEVYAGMLDRSGLASASALLATAKSSAVEGSWQWFINKLRWAINELNRRLGKKGQSLSRQLAAGDFSMLRKIFMAAPVWIVPALNDMKQPATRGSGGSKSVRYSE